MSALLLYAPVVAAGMALALQQVLNANLRVGLGSPWWAGTASYLVGLLAMLLVALLAPGPRPTLEAIGNTHWLTWMGGLLGASFIATGILMVPRLGAATTLVLVVVGQMVCSLLVDHFGVLGVPQHSASPVRLAGAALLILGVVLIRI
jgi:transporter family-2 protein